MAKLPLLVPVFPEEVLATFRNKMPTDLVGLHALSAWGTTSAWGMSVLVAMHEDFHDRILASTAYGFVQRCFRSHLQPQVARRWRQYAERWLGALDAESSRLHEIAATYLSIKNLPLEEHAHAVSGLHPAYLDHYLVLADAIDTHAQSSYVQFVIAETIINCAFHSPLVIRVAALTGAEAPNIGADESPNQRFARLLALLNPNACSQLVTSLRHELAAVAASRGLRSFDADIEDHWLSLDKDVLGAVHPALTEYVARWFLDRDYGGIPIPEENTISDAAFLFVESAYRRGVFVSDATFLGHYQLGDGELKRRVCNAGDSVFFNTPTVTPSDVPKLPKQASWVVPTHPPATIAVICAKEVGRVTGETDWFVRVCGSTDNCSTLLVTTGQLTRFLKGRNQRWVASGDYVDNDLYVIGLPAPVSAAARRVTLATMRSALSMFAKFRPVDEECVFDEGHNIDFLGLERVVFYMHGNLLAWAHFLGAFKDTRYFAFSELERPKHEGPYSGPHDISLAAFPEGMDVHVMRISNVPVTFVRAQNRWAGHYVGSAIVNYQNGSSRIAQLAPDADEVIQAEAFVKLAVSSVEAVWRVF